MDGRARNQLPLKFLLCETNKFLFGQTTIDWVFCYLQSQIYPTMPSTLVNTNEVAKEMEHTPLPQQAESTLGDTYQKNPHK